MLGKAFRSAAAFLFLVLPLEAQVPMRPASAALPLAEVELLEMPAQNNEALLAKEMAERKPGRAPRFAQSIEVDVRPSETGSWEVLPDGRLLWRLRIRSPGAYSINLGFSAFYLPEDATLLLYNPSRSEVLGPFTAADNDDHYQLWTPVLGGDEAVLELQVPASSRSQVQLWLTSVNHDFLNFYGMTTGNCHLDVACGESEGWPIVEAYQEAIQSVAVYGLGGDTFCSGFLINNTNEDCRPYFMTAHHCEVGPVNAPTVVAYWNYENSSCRQPGTVASGNDGDGSLGNFNTGAIYRAGSSSSDFVLLELDDPIPLSANAYFAGWSRAGEPPKDTLACVHHPDGAEKRISISYSDTYPGVWGNGSQEVPGGNHLILPSWDIGSTEYGSSGAPLLDRNNRVVGQLHGGAASCSNNGYDAFGWLNAAWDGPHPDNRLSDWLDPAGEGAWAIDGRWNSTCNVTLGIQNSEAELCAPGTAHFNLEVGEAFVGPVTLSLSGLPAAFDYTFSSNPAVPGSSLSLTVDVPEATLQEGHLDFTVEAAGTYNSLSIGASLLVVTSVPQAPAVLSPESGAVGLPLLPEIQWAEASNALAYDLQLARDSAFSQLVVDQSHIGQAYFSGAVLDDNTDYYCRVRARNLCGPGPWSPIYQFRTAATVCRERLPAGLPIPIDAGDPNSISSALEVEAEGTVAAVRLKQLEIKHSFVGDLSAFLRSPSGTVVKLFDRPGFPLFPFGCIGSDLQLSFSDDAPLAPADLELSCNEEPPAISGAFQPLQAFAQFVGEPAAGSWELIVVDNFNEDGGVLTDWELELCSTFPNEARVFAAERPMQVCQGDSLEQQLYIGTGYEGNVSLVLHDIGSAFSATLDQYLVAPGSFVTLKLKDFSAAGSFEFGLRAADSSSTTDLPLNLEVLQPPGAPMLQNPPDQSLVDEWNVAFQWFSATTADSFRLQVAADSAFNELVVDAFGLQSQYSLTNALPPGPYYWRVKAINECGAAWSKVFSFFQDGTMTSASAGQTEGVFLQAYPNPTDGRLWVEWEGALSEDILLRLYNHQGQLLHTYEVSGDTAQLQLQQLPSGLYLLQWQSGGMEATRRIILK